MTTARQAKASSCAVAPRPGITIAVMLTAGWSVVSLATDEALPPRTFFLRTPSVRLNYQTVGRTDETRAQLWFSGDRGATWQEGATSPDARINWRAPGDGLFGLYVVVSNAAGDSSPPPAAGTAPQEWVCIDTQPPSAQFLSVRPDEDFAIHRRMPVRWTVVDEHLAERGIRIEYRPVKDALFKTIEENLPNAGVFEWTVPNDVAGPIELRLTARDMAGHEAAAVSPPVVVPSPAAPKPNAGDQPAAAGVSPDRLAVPPQPSTPAPPAALPVPPEPLAVQDVGSHEQPVRSPAPAGSPVPTARRQAEQLFDEATIHRSRGEWSLAEERLRQALELDGTLVSARCDLAGVLFKRQRHDDAAREYESILRDQPEHPTALRGFALVQAAQKQYGSALDSARRLVTVRPEDPDAWMLLGDVSMFTGDRGAARQAWLKAQSLPDASQEVIERAGKRLAIYRPQVVP